MDILLRNDFKQKMRCNKHEYNNTIKTGGGYGIPHSEKLAI